MAEAPVSDREFGLEREGGTVRLTFTLPDHYEAIALYDRLHQGMTEGTLRLDLDFT